MTVMMERTVITAEKLADLYERAADRLGRVGWDRWSDGPAEGPNCVNGAMRWTLFDENREWAASADETDLLNTGYSLLTKVLMLPLVDWNDEKCKGQGEAKDLLRTTARQLRNGDLTVPEVPA